MIAPSRLPQGHALQEGKYLVDAVLGQGGFGITYQGTHAKLHQRVAIKELVPVGIALREPGRPLVRAQLGHETQFSQLVRSFVDEGRVIANVKHANLVSVQDYFEENGTAYLVMAFAEGANLHSVVKERGPLPEPTVAHILGRLVSALRAVHKKGIYHLDIKPLNVLLQARDEPVLVDFGAALTAARRGMDVPIEGPQAKTLIYAPPELIANGVVGPRTDLFELAMLAHELLTGSPPPSALERMQGSAWTPVELPGAWASMLARALALDPDERPESVKSWWSAYELPQIPRLEDGRVRVTPQVDLAHVLASIPAGTEVRLAEGKHVLGKRSIETPVSIVAEDGADEVVLECQITIELKQGEMTLSGLTVTGGEGTPIVLERGKLRLESCDLQGEMGIEVHDGLAELHHCGGKARSCWGSVRGGELRIRRRLGNAGSRVLHAYGEGKIDVEDVKMWGRRPRLLVVEDEARAKLENWKSVGRVGGLECSGQAELIALGVVFNGMSRGLTASGQARVELLDASFVNVSGTAIDVRDSASVVVTAGSVRASDGCGVVARDSATLELLGTELKGIASHAFEVTGKSAMTAKSVSVSKVAGTALRVAGQAEVTINGLTAEECAHPVVECIEAGHLTITGSVVNFEATGIAVAGNARLEASKVHVGSSPKYGVEVSGDAIARLNQCRVQSSARAGVKVEGNATVLVRDSRLSENGTNGASVGGTAALTLIGTTCYANENSGVYVSGQGETTVVDCTLASNGYHGLEALSRSRQEVTLCHLRGNRHFGVAAISDGLVVIRGATFAANGKGDVNGEPWDGSPSE